MFKISILPEPSTQSEAKYVDAQAIQTHVSASHSRKADDSYGMENPISLPASTKMATSMQRHGAEQAL